jgi:hypothetical protein
MEWDSLLWVVVGRRVGCTRVIRWRAVKVMRAGGAVRQARAAIERAIGLLLVLDDNLREAEDSDAHKPA